MSAFTENRKCELQMRIRGLRYISQSKQNYMIQRGWLEKAKNYISSQFSSALTSSATAAKADGRRPRRDATSRCLLAAVFAARRAGSARSPGTAGRLAPGPRAAGARAGAEEDAGQRWAFLAGADGWRDGPCSAAAGSAGGRLAEVGRRASGWPLPGAGRVAGLLVPAPSQSIGSRAAGQRAADEDAPRVCWAKVGGQPVSDLPKVRGRLFLLGFKKLRRL